MYYMSVKGVTLETGRRNKTKKKYTNYSSPLKEIALNLPLEEVDTQI